MNAVYDGIAKGEQQRIDDMRRRAREAADRAATPGTSRYSEILDEMAPRAAQREIASSALRQMAASTQAAPAVRAVATATVQAGAQLTDDKRARLDEGALMLIATGVPAPVGTALATLGMTLSASVNEFDVEGGYDCAAAGRVTETFLTAVRDSEEAEGDLRRAAGLALDLATSQPAGVARTFAEGAALQSLAFSADVPSMLVSVGRTSLGLIGSGFPQRNAELYSVATGAIGMIAEQPTDFAGLADEAHRRASSTDVGAGKANLSAAFEEIKRRQTA